MLPVCNILSSVLLQQNLKFKENKVLYSRKNQFHNPQMDQCYSSVLQLIFI